MKISVYALAGLALLGFAWGCGGGSATDTVLSVTMSPASTVALVGSLVQFTVVPSEAVDTAAFYVNDVQGGNATVGTISTNGIYQAPAVVPSGTITIKATVSNSGNGKSASTTSTVTLDSGVRVSISGSKFTIGTGETYPFAASVIGVPSTASISGVCDNSSSPSCKGVTWSVTGIGSIDPNTGIFSAPGTTGAGTVTAQSVYDPTQKATASVTIVTAADPTITSISNTVGAVGALFQDIYLNGSNFISTTNVFLNGTQLPPSNIVATSGSSLRARIPDSLLTSPGTFEIKVAQQVGGAQSCAPNACQITLSAVPPAVVGSTPDSFPQGSSPTIRVNGGFFGTTSKPVVTAQFGSQGASGSVVSARELDVVSGGSDISTPGLVPIKISSTIAGATVPPSAVNVAVQPTYSAPPSVVATVAVGLQPSAVAINTATGVAVVANRGTNDISVINVATGATVFASICTAGGSAPCAASSPASVAVDNLRNIALVANSGSTSNAGTCTGCSIAIIDLAAGTVGSPIPADPTGKKIPIAIGVNPLTGIAIVAYQGSNFAGIIDLNKAPRSVNRIVAANTGVTGPRIAVSPRLNWALITPGGAGSLSLVDLGRQNVTAISSAICSGSANTAIVTAIAPGHTLRLGDPVLITGAGGTGINGVFGVTGVSGDDFTYSSPSCSGSSPATATYALPIATVATNLTVQGVAFNDETEKAILVDASPTSSQAFVFSVLDQTSSSAITGLPANGNAAAAFNPFTNTAVIVNQSNGTFTVVDPGAPATLANSTGSVGTTPVDVAVDPGTNRAVIANQGSNNVSIVSLGSIRPVQVLQVSRQVSAPTLWSPPEIIENSTLTSAPVYADETLRIVGKGFTGASVVRLNGDATGVQILAPVTDRVLNVKVLGTRLQAGGVRRYTLDVVDGAALSNAGRLSVAQSVDLTTSGCTLPQGVAIDYSARNLALVTAPGCNSVAIINLANGTGSTVAVGTNPQGVAVGLQSGLAVVANQSSNNASIVDVAGATVVATVNTDPGPVGVAIDPALSRAVVTANSANTISTFAVSSTPDTPTSFPVQVRPVGVAINPDTHVAAVANTSSNTVSLVDISQTAATVTVAASGLPAGVTFDPASSDYLTVQSLTNQMLLLDPISRTTTAIRIGINPTSIAYNFETGTAVSTNSASQTMTVFDFLSGRVRQVFSMRASSRFAVDIHPFTNVAVIADSAGNRVLLRPLP